MELENKLELIKEISKQDMKIFNAKLKEVEIIIKDESKNLIVNNDNSKEFATTSISTAKKFIKFMEDLRKAKVKPLNDKVKSINNYFKKHIDVFRNFESETKNKILCFERKIKEEAEQKRRELEEEERERQKQLERLKKGKEVTEIGEHNKMYNQIEENLIEEAKQEQEKQQELENRAKLKTQRFEESGTQTTIVKLWKFEVIDPDVVPIQYLKPDEAKIKKAVSNGVREIPGVKIYKQEQLRVK